MTGLVFYVTIGWLYLNNKIYISGTPVNKGGAMFGLIGIGDNRTRKNLTARFLSWCWLKPKWLLNRRYQEERHAEEMNSLRRIMNETYLEGQGSIMMLNRMLEEYRRQLRESREQNASHEEAIKGLRETIADMRYMAETGYDPMGKRHHPKS